MSKKLRWLRLLAGAIARLCESDALPLRIERSNWEPSPLLSAGRTVWS